MLPTCINACTNMHCFDCYFVSFFNHHSIIFFTVSGQLPSVGSLSTFINSSTIIISWSPPFTLPGTTITGYNISVTSNGTTNEYFTLNNYYLLQLSNITYLPCDKINITVSGYNGLDGKAITASGWYGYTRT